MKRLLLMVGVGLLIAVPAWADLVQPAAPGASVRVSEATGSANTAAALSLADANTNTKANFVYYCSLDLPNGTEIPGGSGGNGGTDDKNGNGGTNTGGGDGGSANGGGGEPTNGGGGQVPAPAASVLALVGMACVTWLKRRV